MSRWAIDFQGHAFWSTWATLKEVVNRLIIDDQTVTSAVEELARLKKVIEYISSVMDGIDPELTPRSVWDQFHPQAEVCRAETLNYSSSRNAVHLINANAAADNLLTYVRPYMVLPEQSLVASREAAGKLSQAIEDRLQHFGQIAEERLILFRTLANEIEKNAEKSREATNQIRLFEHSIFGIPGDPDGATKWRIDSFEKKVVEQSTAISELHTRLIMQREADGSIESGCVQGLARVNGLANQTQNAFDSVVKGLQELGRYHALVFGTADENSSKGTPGLKGELESRMEQSEKMLLDHDSKHSALLARIESLIPGATSAGLATAYRDMKDSFNERITTYSRLFYGSLLIILTSGIISITQNITLSPLSYELVNTPEWEGMLRQVIYKIPIFIPGVWLAIFSATRRNQYERLQQEYAHKEALAKSYESYRKQIEDLGQAGEGLRIKLIERAIDAIAFNASETLDKPHQEQSPLQLLIEKIKTDELAKLLDVIKPKKD